MCPPLVSGSLFSTNVCPPRALTAFYLRAAGVAGPSIHMFFVVPRISPPVFQYPSPLRAVRLVDIPFPAPEELRGAPQSATQQAFSLDCLSSQPRLCKAYYVVVPTLVGSPPASSFPSPCPTGRLPSSPLARRRSRLHIAMILPLDCRAEFRWGRIGLHTKVHLPPLFFFPPFLSAKLSL